MKQVNDSRMAKLEKFDTEINFETIEELIIFLIKFINTTIIDECDRIDNWFADLEKDIETNRKKLEDHSKFIFTKYLLKTFKIFIQKVCDHKKMFIGTNR